MGTISLPRRERLATSTFQDRDVMGPAIYPLEGFDWESTIVVDGFLPGTEVWKCVDLFSWHSAVVSCDK